MKGLQGLKEKLQEFRDNGVAVWSISRLDSYKNCAQGYKFSYIDKNKGLDNVYSFYGTAIHDAEEVIYNTPNITVEDAKEILSSKFKEAQDYIDNHNLKYEMDRIKPYKEREVRHLLKFGSETIESNFMESVGHYIDNFYLADKKRINETFILLQIGDCWVQGYVDVIQANDKEDKSLHIIDYKTSSNFSAADKIDKGRQLLLYAYGIERLTGYKVGRVSWDMIKYHNVKYKGKTRKRKILYLRKGWVAKFLDEIRSALLEIGTDEFDIPNIMADAIEKNELPTQISHMFEITKGYVDYPITEEGIAEVLEYIQNTVRKIGEDQKFKPRKITEYDSFFCQTLCNSRLICPELKEFREKQKVLGNIEEDDDEVFEDSFENLFG